MNKADYIQELFSTMGQLKRLAMQIEGGSHEERAATMLQFSALNFINQHTQTSVGDLAAHTNLSKSSATQLVERLEKLGFVERIHDTNDRRVVRLAITNAGQAEILSLKKRFYEKLEKLFSNIPESDLRELIRIHTELIQTLKNK